MSLAVNWHAVTRGPRPNHAMLTPIVSRRGTRALCTRPKATAFVSDQGPISTSRVINNVPRQRIGYSYVNFKATAVDFERVLDRLAASSSLPSEVRAAPGAAAPTPPASQSKPWGGLLGSLMGGLRGGSQPHEHIADVDCSLDDGSPLSHAVVMFTATWCGPCKVVYRELKLAAGRLQDRAPTAVIVVDVEQNKELASQLDIKALPTLLYLGPDGTRGPIFTQGPVSASFILDALDRAVGFGGRDLKSKWRKL